MTAGRPTRRAIGILGVALGCGLFALAPRTAMASTSVVKILPGGNNFGVAVNPNTNRVYVADGGGTGLRVIDGDSNTQIATVALPAFIRGVAVNPTTNKIYVAGYANGFCGNKVRVIDGTTNTLLPDITLPGCADPVWVAVNPGLNRIYVGNELSWTVSVINGATDAVLFTTPALVGPPTGLGVHTGTGNVYVATANNPGPFQPTGPPGGGINSVTVLNSAGGPVTTIGPAGITNPRDLVVDSAANRAYVANYSNGTMSIIDTVGNTVLSTISAGVNPFGLALNRARNRMYVTGGDFGSVVYVVNLVTLGTEQAVDVGLDMKDIEYNPVNDMIYANSYSNTNIYILQDVGEVCSGGTESWWNNSWRRRRAIDINNGNINETFTNFPLLVKLDPSRIDYSKTKPGGDDLRFVAGDDSTLLSYEIEKWNFGGTSWLWVRVPTITGISSTRIYMYYDNAAAPAVSNGPAVWDAAFSMVQHLEETSGRHFDSTSNANHSDPGQTNLTVEGNAVGQIDGADEFRGTSNVDVFDSPSLNMGPSDDFTIEAWVKTTNSASGFMTVVSKEQAATNREYQLWLSLGVPTLWIRDGVTNLQLNPATPNIADGQWHYLVGRLTRFSNTASLLVDGVEVANGSGSLGDLTSTNPLVIGEEGDLDGGGPRGGNWDGYIDEVRISKTARSFNWIEAQKRSMRDTYVLFGEEDGICNLRSIGNRVYGTGQALPANGAGTTVNVTIGSRTVFGVGTAWKTANRGRGDSITFGVYTGTVQSVDSNNQLTLATPSTVGGSQSYTISRKFNSLAAWEACIDGSAGCGPDPAVTNSLVADNRGEIGIAYKDAVLAAPLVIDSAVVNNTDAIHTITLTADLANRHHGIAGAGVVVDNGVINNPAISVRDDYVTVEWMEIQGGSGGSAWGIEVRDTFISPGSGSQGASRIVLRNNLIHVPQFGISLDDPDQVTDAYNNFVYGGFSGIRVTSFNLPTWARVRLFSNTIYNYSSSAFSSSVTQASGTSTRITLRNNLAAATSLLNDYELAGNPHPSSSNNMSAQNAGPYAFNPNPAGPPCCTLFGQNLDTQVNFVNRAANNLHIQTSSTAKNTGANLNALFDRDIDSVIRLADPSWEIGADDISQTTAVTLLSFTGTGRDGAVDLAWTTASELQNLGFHVYRATAASGPWTQVTSAIIPGLGSSPTGKSYSWRDLGLANGTTYYYLLEDVETTGTTDKHGPVSATPAAGATGGGGDSEGQHNGPGGVAYGDPRSSSLKVLERTNRGVLLELRTGGFYAVPEGDGTVRIEVPGFEESPETGLPLKRGVVEALAGKRVRVVSVEASEESSYAGLLAAPPRQAEVAVGAGGELQASRGRRLRAGEGEPAARLAGTAFQEDVKKAEVLFAPLRRESGRLVLSGRILARLEFSGTERDEVALGGARGRRVPWTAGRPGTGVLAQLVVAEPGLYRLAYEELFASPGPGLRPREIQASRLRLSRQGEPVAYHLEPNGQGFRPGAALYFVSEGSSLNPEGETVYELEEAGPSLRMPVMDTSLGGRALEEYQATATWEENHYYQAGLLEAEDLWQWDVVISPAVMVRPFSVTEVRTSSSSPARLTVWLQGASDFEAAPDHHLRFRVNGMPVGETTFDGRVPNKVEMEVSSGVLQEGSNQLEIENAGDTGAAYSMVFLNRFSLRYPRRLRAAGGELEGGFENAGQAVVSGLSSPAAVVDTTVGKAPRWVRGSVTTAQGLAFGAEAGHRYLLTASPHRATVRRITRSTLRSGENQADYLLIGPQAFLDVAAPLLDHRRSQGLAVKAVSTEELFQEFGHGEPRAEAIKEFLEYAYHRWQAPSVRYVLLLGDATYDPKDYLNTGVKNRVPAFTIRTTYLWTASDPAYAAVNGNDLMPDVALGRLSAASVDEVLVLVEKVLAFENGVGDLSGRAVLVADNADVAGNFEQDSDELAATVLASRDPQKVYYSELGVDSRARIVEAFDAGASLVSYVGHGGTAVWASENIFNTHDVATLAPQPQQPLLMTMNCLNGFFHFPPLDSLSEAFVKAEGKGAVAAFSPSGLSLNEPAHAFHRALLAEIVSGRHERLGDAVLAAQAAYVDSGAFPELLSIYQLLGDPALRIR